MLTTGIWWIPISYPEKPELTVLQLYHEVVYGNTLVLECYVSHLENVNRVYWLKHQGDTTIPLLNEKQKCTLVIKNVKDKDAGKYVCCVESSSETETSEPIDVVVIHGKLFKFLWYTRSHLMFYKMIYYWIE